MVRVIREFQPDVIVTRFSPVGGGTHGHHTASTVLALEAFKISGDPKEFPEQITRDGLAPWQPKRIFWNSFRGAGPTPSRSAWTSAAIFRCSANRWAKSAPSAVPTTAARDTAVSARAVSRPDDFLPLDGQPVGKDLFRRHRDHLEPLQRRRFRYSAHRRSHREV